MKNRVLLFLSLLFLAATVSPEAENLFSRAAPAHVGLICLADPSSTNSSNPCPASPSTFNGPSPSPSVQKLPTQIIIGVYVSNSDALNGFDIQLKTNSSVLKPAGASLSGSIVHSGPGTSISPILCIGGIGPQCGPTDGPDVLDVEAVMLSSFTNNPATGLLFTATYNITGATSVGGIAIGYQTGCARSSIAGSSPLICVTIADGTNTRVPETIQTAATFDNSVQPNWVALTSQKQTLVFVRGISSDSATITATAENGWPSFSTDTVTFSALTSSNSLSANLFPGPCSTNGVSCSVNVTVSIALGGIGGAYSLTVLGTYVFTDPNIGLSDTLAAPVVFQVLVQDVTINLTPAGTVYMFGTLPLAATVQTLGGYAGTVTLLTQVVNPTSGMTFQYPQSFSVGVNGVATKTVNVTSTTFNLYIYQMRVSITGSGCVPSCSRPSITGTASTERFLVSGFKLTPTANNTSFKAGGSSSLTLTAQSLGSATVANDFAGFVTLGSNSSPAGLNITENAPFISLAAGGSTTLTATFTSTRPGNYTVHITGTGGANIANQTAAITVSVLPNISFRLTMSFKGVNATITGSLGVNGVTRTLAGSTFLNVVNGTTGSLIYSKTDSVSVTINPTGRSHFIEEIPTSPLWLATSCEANVNLDSVTCFLSRTPDINHDGNITIVDVAYVGQHFGTSDALANLSGTGLVNINDFSIEILYYGAAVYLP